MDRLLAFLPYPAEVDKFTGGQIAQMSTWGVVPDNQMTMAALHRIRVIPKGSSTETIVNPMDPGDKGWLDSGDTDAPVVPASRML